MATGRGSYQSRVLTQDIPGDMWLVQLTSVACPRITWFEYSLSYAASLCLVADCIDTEVRRGAWEVLVVEVMSFW